MTAFGRLVHQYLQSRGWELKDLAARIAPRNPGTALRKLTEMLNGARRSNPYAASVRSILEIPQPEMDEALRADRRAQYERIEAHQRAEFSPCFWIEVTPDWFPSLITIIGPAVYRRIAAPADLMALSNEEEIIQHAGRLVAAHFDSGQRRVPPEKITAYVYRRKFDLGYRFTPQGTFLEKTTTPILEPVTYFHLG